MSVRKGGALPKTYKGVDVSKLKDFAFGGDGSSGFFSLDQFNTEVAIRLLPPVGKMQLPWVDHRLHFNRTGGVPGSFDLGDDRKGAITCTEYHGQGPCPVCEVQRWLRDAGQDVLADGLDAKTQYLTNILVRETQALKKWQMPASVGKSVKALMLGKVGDVTDPIHGRDLLITKTGNPKQWNTIRYQVIPDVEVQPVGIEGWDTQVRDLTENIRFITRDEAVSALIRTVGEVIDVRKALGLPAEKKAPAKGKKS